MGNKEQHANAIFYDFFYVIRFYGWENMRYHKILYAIFMYHKNHINFFFKLISDIYFIFSLILQRREGNFSVFFYNLI